MVQATDGGNTTRVVSPNFDAPIKPAYAAILSPRSKESVNGRWVTFHGQGYFLEEEKPEFVQLSWTSSRDGKLGTGSVVQTPLSKGTHDITLLVGEGARQGSASIVLQVN